MKFKRKTVIILMIIILFGIGICRFNTFTPIGSIRCECLLQGHLKSATFLHAKKDVIVNKSTTIYIITSFVPIDYGSRTHLDSWTVKKIKMAHIPLIIYRNNRVV